MHEIQYHFRIYNEFVVSIYDNNVLSK